MQHVEMLKPRETIKLRGHLQHCFGSFKVICCIESKREKLQVALHGSKKIFAARNIKNVAETLQQSLDCAAVL